MSSLSSLDTTNNPEVTFHNSHTVGAPGSSSSSVNKRFVSVLIDKDEDYITKRNATFDLNDVHRFRNESKNVFHSMKKKSSVVNNTKPSVHKSNNNRRKFYRWSKCNKWEQTEGSCITTSGSPACPSSPQRIASRLGLTSKRTASENVLGLR
mmetsp:Transcript_2884/g.5406  ORF Transcript_2884/g.5406 Transcript_2884/m.5406 type:complete len:152 (-) Transcript_2884:222-677(-)